MNKSHHEILKIAVPSIVSNITVPLLGLIDVTIVGHLGAASYIGAIAVGGMLFNIIYWLFGFLRMGTGGMTSQAFGRQDNQEMILLLMRSLSIGLLLSVILICCQYPIEKIAFLFIDTSQEIATLAGTYFRICIWGAPAVLALYSFYGWFIGMQNSKFPMMIAITQNVVNILVSLLLVYGLDMKIEGVALGTLIAQYAGLLMALVLGHIKYHYLAAYVNWKEILHTGAMYRFFQVNRDIFLRTVCVIGVTTFFTSTGAAQGEIILAVNTLLMQLFTLFSYIMDGFAYAGEALTGKYVGAKQPKELHQTIKNLFYWGIGLSLIFTAVYAIGGTPFLHLLTNEQEVIEAAKTYFPWVLAIPLASFAAFLMDGIFIGVTATHLMLQSMSVAAGSFFLVYYGGRDLLGNHALWIAFLTYLALRGVVQAILGRKIFR